MSNNKVAWVCSDEFNGDPDKTPVRVKGNRKRANELINEYKDNGYRKTDKYLN